MTDARGYGKDWKRDLPKIDIMVMVQGDEPLTYPEMIDEASTPMLEDKYQDYQS